MTDKNKIGGWLLLPAFGLIVAPILSFVDIANNFSHLSKDSFTQNIVQITGLYPFYLFELATKIAIFSFLLFLAYLFFNKKPSTPKAMVVFFITAMAFAFIKFILGMSLLETSMSQRLYFSLKNSNIIGVAVACAIWIPYFFKSQRVIRTFKK